jgi:hypothetical protein
MYTHIDQYRVLWVALSERAGASGGEDIDAAFGVHAGFVRSIPGAGRHGKDAGHNVRGYTGVNV